MATRGSSVQHLLPTPISRFVGREHELARLQSLVLDSRLLTLTGPGGTGSEFRQLLQRAGFDDVRVQRLHGPRDYIIAQKP
jgi:hypothetical protein